MVRVKALFYGINGTGLGHIARLLNIAREARELLHTLGIEADFQFLTTSEAPQVAWDFPVYKLPSKTVVAETDTSNQEFAGHAQFFITNLVASFRPDILVMDTMPQGSHGEFLALRAFCKRKVLIARHVHDAIARSAAYQAHLALYDRIIVPDDTLEEHRYAALADVRDRSVFTGAIHGFRADAALRRADVRAQFCVRDDQRLVYVSAGGGGDAAAARDLRAIVDVVRKDPARVVLVAYGPLYRGVKCYASNVIPLSEPETRHYFRGVDYAVSAAGYNTYEELLAAGVPTAFFSQVKGMDQQDERIRIGVARGWHRALCGLDADTIQEAVTALENSMTRRQIYDALAARPRADGAFRAAVELLQVHATLARSPVKDGDVRVIALQRVPIAVLASGDHDARDGQSRAA